MLANPELPQTPSTSVAMDLLVKPESKGHILDFGFWIADFGLRILDLSPALRAK